MAGKILGIDLGTNSIGLAVRDTDNGENITDQLEYYTSIIFKSGVGNGDKGEFSYASERTRYRSIRRLYQSRKYRIWATLRLLIEYGCCPLTIEELDQWSRYDKSKGLKRQYPINATKFEQWVRLDFNYDGIPEYSSPYQLRAELIDRLIDWNDQTDKYKFGRAMYHIAQRRGFKSSKGETLKEANEDEDSSTIDISEAMQKSEEKKSKVLEEYMRSHNLQTVGCAFALLERDGIRVRNSEYQAVQKQCREEVDAICKRQNIHLKDPELYTRLISTKKGEGTIFYRRPLRSQRGNVGECTLEKGRRRCPISHPDYEEYRALTFINNIKFRLEEDGKWLKLSNEQRNRLFEKLFTRANATFKFEEVKNWIAKEYPGHDFNYKNHTINYPDYTTVAGCPVINRLSKIVGNEWRTAVIETDKCRTNYKTGEVHTIRYNYEDIWHLCYNSDDYEELADLAKERIGLNEEQIGNIKRLWSVLQEGYAPLSLKAIRNILPFLREGMIYSEAVAVAKIPDIIGKEKWTECKETINEEIKRISAKISTLRTEYNIANTLIANYKSLSIENQKAYRDYQYKLDGRDKEDVLRCIIDSIGLKVWNTLQLEEQQSIQETVESLYQQFFSSTKRDYYKLPHQSDALKEYLSQTFPEISPKEKWDALYHHSQISLFPHQKATTGDIGGCIRSYYQLGTPNIGSIKNPVAMRTLHTLRRAVNELLKHGMIDEDTRVVVETARDMNDANWRKAIERYQNERKKENDLITNIIKDFRPNYSNDDIEKGRLLFEQIESGDFKEPDIDKYAKASRIQKEKAERFALDLQKYKLWKEQKFRCLYTGDAISITKLFDGNAVDIEHTIPRSISFNDSLTNRTVCSTHFNRVVKGNLIPTQLSNYKEIKERIKPWEETVEHCKSQIELWKKNARTATTVDRKDECIQQKHLWELELDYWQTKVKTFTIQKDELDLGFRNRQLVDTRIITKYAFHYLKSVFTRVDVQKGRITADFRKILGVQSVDEKKDRAKHSHHAVDATILTMIPVAAKRDRIIELFYQVQEAPDAEKASLNSKLSDEIKSCKLGNVSNLVETIETNILINHISKDQTITPAKRKLRIHGKIQYKDKQHKEPYYAQGDCIRGKIHDDTFLAKIKPPKYVKDDNGDYIISREHGKTIYEEEPIFVVRRELNKLFTGRSNWTWEILEKNIVNKELYSIIRKQFPEDVTFKEAVTKGIYMLDKRGNKINRIRHIRCITDNKEPLPIKKQTYLSKQEYKTNYYAGNNTNSYMAIYWSGKMGDKRLKEVRTLFDITKSKKLFGNISVHDSFEKSKENIPLYAIIRPGTNVIVFDKNEIKKGNDAPTEMIARLREMDDDELQKRLYVINSFEKNGTTILIHNNEARPEKELGRGQSFIDLSNPNPKDRVSITTRYMLIEGIHFTISGLGKISFDKND
ncbi:MAG: hypothetical protein IK126_10260 [Bacteroidales bacterium]|nr:hypothetical protein [Bacteroidales bacterium]